MDSHFGQGLAGLRHCTEGRDYHCVTLAVLFMPVLGDYKIILLILKKKTSRLLYIGLIIMFSKHQYRAKACPFTAFINTVKILEYGSN